MKKKKKFNQSLIEYILTITLIVIAIIVLITFMSGRFSTMFSNVNVITQKSSNLQ